MHDAFMLYACQGRLFFDVGELDRYEFTWMLEGIGGCGKSTVMKVTQLYWPPHLRGILSSNMQPQFGLAAVSRGGRARIICCNEVSEALQVVQEEWQTSVSGEWGSYAVNNQQELLVLSGARSTSGWEQFPRTFNNLAGQVSRRLAGVLMTYPVQPRDGTIFDRIRRSKLGALQRKVTLAYHEFVAIHGTTDPMSTPERLPPAFAAYYRRSMRETNPFEDFLGNGEYVVVDPEGGRMLLTRLRELYNDFLADNDRRPSARWGEDLYRGPFAQRAITVVQLPEVTIDGECHTNAKVALGVRPADPAPWYGRRRRRGAGEVVGQNGAPRVPGAEGGDEVGARQTPIFSTPIWRPRRASG